MGTKYPEFFAALSAPIHPNNVRFLSKGDRQIPYITARTVMNRLDEVAGPENWAEKYITTDNGVVCELSVTLPGGELVTKIDMGANAGMSNPGDDDKSGFSDAFKRAGVKFGIGRELYGDGQYRYGVTDDQSEQYTVRNQQRGFAPNPAPPRNPAPAYDAPRHAPSNDYDQPLESTRPAPPPPQRAPQNDGQPQSGGNGGGGNAPRSGKALFAWTKDMEQRHEVGLLKYLNGWAKLQDFPNRMIDWDADQVALAHAEAVRKLASIAPSRSDSYEEALSN